MQPSFNVVIVGGSGFWTEVNHIPNLIQIKQKMPSLKVVGICDINNPYDTALNKRKNLHALLEQDQPLWIRAANFNEASLAALDEVHAKTPLDLVIIACSPTIHFDYSMWAMKNGVSVVCDKPLIDVENAASDIDAAKSILRKYYELIDAYKKAKIIKPYLSFSLILRRRALPAFNVVAERLEKIADKYGAGINHLNILNHNGIYKYPEEMQGTGAHDFSSGVGALSHSSYHYIDLFNRYLSIGKGDIAYIVPKLVSVYRVKDYLDTEGYRSLHSLNKHTPIAKTVTLPDAVLACELDFSFHLDFIRSDGKRIGDGNFISNHLSFSPRTRDYSEGITEPAQFKDGGRTSHLYVDIHQSGLQNLQIIKNDVAFQGPSIIFRSRTHPEIKDVADQEMVVFDDAYNKTEVHLLDMLALVVDALVNKQPVKSDLVVDILEDELNIKLFGKFYELIARNYRGDESNLSADDDRITLD